MEVSASKALENIGRSSTLAVAALVITCLVASAFVLHLNFFEMISKILNLIMLKCGNIIKRREDSYHRDRAIGKIKEKSKKRKIYIFFRELSRDLGMLDKGVTPFKLIFITLTLCALISMVISTALFGNLFLMIWVYPIVCGGVICGMYTKANLAHDKRIEDVIEAENIISSSIAAGVTKAIRDNKHLMPISVRPAMDDFLANVESKNIHIKLALEELADELGPTSEDFIKQCIQFELAEEPGIAGVFKDFVDVNNIKMNSRIELKRIFEKKQFIILLCDAAIALTFVAALAVFPEARDVFFGTTIGQVILCLDVILIVGQYIYLTALRAKEV